MIWIPCDVKQPDKDGTYLVTTVNGSVRFDRYVGGVWGLCNPHNSRGRYRNHLAWGAIPQPYQPKEGRI